MRPPNASLRTKGTSASTPGEPIAAVQMLPMPRSFSSRVKGLWSVVMASSAPEKSPRQSASWSAAVRRGGLIIA